MQALAVALIAIVAIAIGLGLLLARAEGLGFLQPRTTGGISASAHAFCTERCRTPEGNCPLTASSEPAADCPLWKYVKADAPTAMYGSPFPA